MATNAAAYARAYRKRNLQRIRAQELRRREKQREKLAAYARDYRRRNPPSETAREQRRAYNRRYREDNKESLKARSAPRFAARARSNAKKIDEIKATTPCADCGRKFHPVAMDFDHRPDEVKLGTIADLRRRMSWPKIAREIAKCDVVCANCHRIRTHVTRRTGGLLAGSTHRD